MKKLLFLIAIVPLFMTMSCSKDSSSSQGGGGGNTQDELLGFWSEGAQTTSSSTYHTGVHEFVGNNIVYIYKGRVYNKSTVSGIDYEEIPTRPEWYYLIREAYTYERIDDKIYIPMKPEIITVVGNNLIVDGSSKPLSRWY